MYRRAPLRLAVAQSRWFAVPAVMTIVCPLLGGRLLSAGPRLPFAIAAARYTRLSDGPPRAAAAARCTASPACFCWTTEWMAVPSS